MLIKTIEENYKKKLPRFEMLSKDETCTVFHIENNTGDGYMSFYELFDGIYLLFMDCHIENVDECCTVCLGKDVMEINHCREGRIECISKSGKSVYLGKGDFQISFCDLHFCSASFPTTHYHGVTIMIDYSEITNQVKEFLNSFDINVDVLHKKLYKADNWWLLRRNENIEHIFAEIYSAWSQKKKSYLCIKTMELLLFLSVIDLEAENIHSTYYFKGTTQTVKEIHRYLTSNLNKNPTIKELSEQFNIPPTSLKNCFKDMFGEPLMTYMRTYRIHHAANLLFETNASITEIALAVGWENSSKFSSVFSKIMGTTPTEYRKVYV